MSKRKDSGVNFQLAWCFILLFVFFGFRGLPVLNDTHHYFNAQMSLITETYALNEPFYKFNPDSKWGAGFQILQRIILKIIPEPYALITVTAFIFSIGTLWVLKKFTNRIALSIFILLGMSILFAQYAAIRQSMATVFFYLAIYFSFKNKHIYGLLTVWVATQFHPSARVLFVVYFLTMLPVTRRNIKMTLGMGGVVLTLLYPLLAFFEMGDNHYVTDMDDRSTIVWSALITTILIGGILYTCYYLSLTYKIKQPPKVVVWCSIMGLFFNFASMIIIAFDRLALYVVLFNVIMFIYYIDRSPVFLRKRLLNISIVLLYGRIIFELLLKNEWKHLVPYSFYDFGRYLDYVDFGY